MLQKIIRFLKAIRKSISFPDRFLEESEKLLISNGTVLSILNRDKSISSLQEIEFKIFSQWGDDGIIQYLVNNINIKNRTFIEFGIDDFSESNCRFLMMKDNWSGYVIDGSDKNITRLKQSY